MFTKQLPGCRPLQVKSNWVKLLITNLGQVSRFPRSYWVLRSQHKPRHKTCHQHLNISILVFTSLKWTLLVNNVPEREMSFEKLVIFYDLFWWFGLQSFGANCVMCCEIYLRSHSFLHQTYQDFKKPLPKTPGPSGFPQCSKEPMLVEPRLKRISLSSCASDLQKLQMKVQSRLGTPAVALKEINDARPLMRLSRINRWIHLFNVFNDQRLRAALHIFWRPCFQHGAPSVE